MKELIEFLLTAIVDHPEDIKIEEEIKEPMTDNGSKFYSYIIEVNQEDIPFVIGKNGRTIKSIRNLVKIKAIKEGVYADVRLKSE